MAARAKPEGCCAPAAVEPLETAELERMTLVAKALADPTRIEIMRLLAPQAGPLCACDIVDHFHLSQPTVSHHLKILRKAGLVIASRRGLWMFYRVDASAMAALRHFAAALQPG